MNFDFLKPQKYRGFHWRRLRWWEQLLRWLFYGLWLRRCIWCGRWFWSWHPSWDEYCSQKCCDDELLADHGIGPVREEDEPTDEDYAWLCACGRFNDDPWCCVCGAEPPYGCLSDTCECKDPEPEPGEYCDPFEEPY